MAHPLPRLRTTRRLWQAAAAGTIALLLAACGGGGGGGDRPATSMGSLRIGLTDAPACGYDAVHISVQRVRVHQSSIAEPSDGGWSELVFSPARRIDLLSLTNGVFADLGTLSLPAGTYSQVRLVLAPNSGGPSPANAVTLTGNGEVALTTPSAQQSGTKINANVTVPAGQVAELMLDFDACKSVVRAGNSGQYILKPVIAAIPVFAAAGHAIEGFVDPALAGVTISAQQGGVPVRSTAPGAFGRFLLSPMPVGSYTLVVSAPGHATAVVTGVPVTDSTRTVIASTGTPIALPTSLSRSAAGLVTFTGSSTIPDATVRAIQRLTGGPDIELIARQVDPTNGAYAFSLPIAAPGRAAFATGATGYSFTPDTAAAAHYALQALVPGKPTQEANIDLTNADATTNFAFTP